MKTETYVCQACHVEVTRPVARGQRPKWCPDCRARGAWNHSTFVCDGCGETATGCGTRFCSQLCRVYVRFGPTVCKWSPPRAPRVVPEPFVPEPRECAWCGDGFMPTVRAQVFCSLNHMRKAKRNRRRGRQYGSTSHFTWAQFMRVFIAFGRCCAYCELPIVGQPEPDHVIPLSRGGSNSIANILPSCHSCNADKRDLLLAEWAVDRQRRSKPGRITAWSIEDLRVRHLTSLLAA